MSLRNSFAIFGLTLLAVLVVSCGSGGGAASTGKFSAFIPYLALSTAEVVSLGANGFTGSDEAIANAILAWQNDHMKLVTPMEKADVSYAMRWNYILPGIYPVSQIITSKLMDDSGTEKIYGVCWDFAAVFNALARYYGLEVRVTAWKTYMSGVPGGESGLSPDEYNALEVKLAARGLDFSYEQINSAIRETWIHYRAEVKIDGVWRSFDGTGPTGDYLNDNNYEVAAWDEGLNTDLAVR